VDEAEDILAAQAIDMAILDMNLPGRTGLEALSIIRQSTTLSALPVIVVTANPQFQNQAEEYEIELFLVKPFSIAQLRTLVKRYLA